MPSTRSRIAHRSPWLVRFTSFLYALCWIAVPVTIAVFAAGMILKDDSLLKLTVGCVVLLILLNGAAALAGHRLNCSVCANPVFLVRACRKHDRARKFLGFSYRLGIVFESLFRNRFYCMYCGERIPLQKKAASPEVSREARAETPPPVIASAGSDLPPRRF